MHDQACPCGSQKAYADCCGQYHNGHAKAPTAEALMRSRYSAFARQASDYLIATLHPDKRKPDEAASLQHSFHNTRWLGLAILATTRGTATDTEGQVEFIAHYQADSKTGYLHERSRFVKTADQWFYLDGEMLATPRPGRNDPCWCGSGKKFKKCHG